MRRPPAALPPATPGLQLPRGTPASEALDVPAIPEPGRPESERTERTEPGTWREIIARFEHELGDAVEAEDAGAPDEAAGAPAGRPESGMPGAGEQTFEFEPTFQLEPPVDAETPVDREPPTGLEPPAKTRDEPEDETGRETPVAWEFEAMTTPDYTPPRSIHDPEHDSWPVEAEDGDAVPAWSDEAGEDEEDASEDMSAYDEIGEMILDQVVSADPWDVEPEGEASEGEGAGEFPLNAFIVPAGVQHVPSGYDATDVARRVAHRLDELAQQLRDGGLGALGRAATVDELSRVLAAIVTGYVSRDA